MAQQFYKKVYSIGEGYDALYKGLRTVKYLVRNKKNGQISSKFIERIMLAVTEVNGCEVCTYGHTKIALEQGMSNEEIQDILSGTTEGIPGEEMKAILFAQHYADTKGMPSKETWETIQEYYGREQAMGILGAIRMIMIGNSYGIAYSALRSRLKGKPVEKTSFIYEIGMILSLFTFLPVAAIHGFVLDIFKAPLVK